MKPHLAFKSFIAIIFALIGLSSLSLQPGYAAESQIDRVLRIGHTTWVGYGPFYIAKAKGLFEKNGVKVELIRMEDTKLLWAAMAAGRLDAICTTMGSFMLYHKPELPLRAVLALDDSYGGDGVVSTGDITSVAGLRGKTVAFDSGTVSEFYINYLLRLEGMTTQDIRPVNMRPDDAGAAFVAGKVDAAVTWEPWLSKAKQATNGRVLVDTSKAPGVIVDILVFKKDFLDQRPGEVRAFVRSWMQAVEFYKSNHEEAIAIMAKNVGGWLEKPADFETALSGARLFGEEDNKRFMVGAKAPALTTTQFAIDLWASQGKVAKGLKASELIDPSFLMR
jgi:NitT/TauT family transport system substrate-binding protein